MKSLQSTLVILALAACTTLFSCKKDYSNVIKLSAADSAKVTTIPINKTIAITLSNPSVGGYSLNNWEYDNTVLRLDNHVYELPVDPKAVGSAGKDTWWFTPLKGGECNVKITAYRGRIAKDELTIFRATIKVE